MRTEVRVPSGDEALGWYDSEDRQLVEQILASKNKGVPRAREIIEFAQHCGYKRIGIAACVGLADQAEAYAAMWGDEFDVTCANCKVCDLQNEDFVPGAEGAACNPVAQARLLAEAGTELNVVMGLCLGHDMLFAKYSEAPSTTLVVKDRVLGHNPVAAFGG